MPLESVERDLQNELIFLNEVAFELSAFSPEKNIYQFAADMLAVIVRDAYILINRFDHQKEMVVVESLGGLKSAMHNAIESLGYDPRGKAFPLYRNDEKIKSGCLKKLKGSLVDASMGWLSETVLKKAEKLLDFKDVYTIDISRKGWIYGSIVLITTSKTNQVNKNLIEIFVNQFSIAIQNKEAEEKLVRSELRYKSIIEDQTEFIVRWTREGAVNFANKSYCNYFKLNFEDLKGKDFFDFVPENQQDRVKRKIGALTSSHPVATDEHVAIKPDGTCAYHQWTDRAIFDQNGRIVEYQSVGRDVTEIKEAEKKIEASKKEALENARMLQIVLNTIPVRVFWKDLDSFYLGCNQLFAKDVGLRSETEIKGKRDHNFYINEVAEKQIKDDRDVIVQDTSNLNYEETQTNLGGEDSWIRICKTPLKDISGNVIGVLGTYEDISERKLIEERLSFQNKSNRLRAEIWKKAADQKVVDENLFIQFVLEELGPVFQLSRATYFEFDKTQKNFIASKQWFLDEVGSSLGEVLSYEMAKYFFEKDIIDVPGDIDKVIKNPEQKNVIKNYVLKKYEKNKIKKNITITFGSSRNPIGLFSFTDCIQDRKWTDLEKSVFVEIVDIVKIKIEQIRYQKALKESTNKYKDLFDNSIDGICITDRSFGFFDANKALCNIVQYSKNELIKLKVKDIIHPEDQDMADNYLRKLLRRKNYDQFEGRILTKDGKTKYVEVSANQIVGNNKDEIIGFRYIIRDVTARKLQEQAIKDIQEAITFKTEEKFFESIVLNISRVIKADYVIISSCEGNDNYVNTLAVCKRNELVGNFSFLIKGTPGESVIGNKMQVYRSSVARLFPNDPFLKQNFIEGYVGIPLFDASQKSIGLLEALYCQRIDEKSLAETVLEIFASRIGAEMERNMFIAELLASKEKAEESDRLKSAFLANMSHEIRTPMNAILGFSELLAEPDIDKEDKAEFITHIKNNGANLLKLINDIVDIAKIEAGQLSIAHTKCDLYEIINEIKTNLEEKKYSSGQSEPEIRVWIDENIQSKIITDGFRLKQILNNLSGNAFKYTSAGFIEIGCRLAESNKEMLEIYVKDTGTGISKDKLNVIFERFRQGDDSLYNIHGGTGLGLSISKNIANLLGGDICVESKLGQGSVFFVRIPYEPVNIEKTNSNLDNVPIVFNMPTKTILIAEDVESNYEIVRLMLRAYNAKILWAKNGQEVMDFIHKEQKIDLILMDLKMPVMNGYITTATIRGLGLKLPIIALTAYALDGDREKAIEAGCDDYLAKPIKKERLHEMVNKYLSFG